MIRRFGFLFLVLLIHGGLPGQVMWQFKTDTLVKWYYHDGDEFNEPVIDTEKWRYSYGYSRSIAGNKEQQYYTDGDNHLLKDGKLSLFAKRDTVNRRLRDWAPDHDSIFLHGRYNGPNRRDFTFTSGMLRTPATYQFGYFEIMFRMPAQKGFWPAFWLFGGDPNEEIDMMELKTELSDRIHVGRHSTLRSENYVRKGLVKRAWGGWVKVKGDLTRDFHVVAGEWTPDYIRFFLNGEVIAFTSVPLHLPKELAVNLAVPANNGPFKPGPADTLKHSGFYEIDYIRVWSVDSSKSRPFNARALPAATEQPAQTALKKKSRFLYGRKSLQKNQGITVSFLQYQSGLCEISVLGKDIPDDAELIFRDQNRQPIFNQRLVYGRSIFDLKTLPKKAGSVEIRAYGRSGHHELRR